MGLFNIKNMKKYITFLKWINVWGKNKVSMSELKEFFEWIWFKNVKTLLNTWNIIFEWEEKLIEKIEILLENKFWFHIESFTFDFLEIEKIVKRNYFKNEQVSKNIQFYVTFTKWEKDSKIPNDESYKILKNDWNIIFSVLYLEKMWSTKFMQILEKNCWKNITTKNYNTIIKIVRF